MAVSNNAAVKRKNTVTAVLKWSKNWDTQYEISSFFKPGAPIFDLIENGVTSFLLNTSEYAPFYK